jgi:hypothetical protein
MKGSSCYTGAVGLPSEYVRGQLQLVNGEPNHDGDHKTFEVMASI